jgi:hypothetical protein
MDRRLRFGLAIAAQVAILAAVPWHQVRARLRGQEITLRTAPVDPFSPFSGFYMTLSYEVERPVAGKVEPGISKRKPAWIVVEKGEPAWTLVGVFRERPAPASGRAILRARWYGGGPDEVTDENLRWSRAEIESAGRFYLPEEKARALEAAMSEEWKRWREQQATEEDATPRTQLLVDMKVDEKGYVALERLRFGKVTLEE